MTDDRAELRAEIERLRARQQELLQLVATLSRAEPFDGELEECRRHRATLIAEVGTLRRQLALVSEGRDGWREIANRGKP